jgi:Holliday junction resolvasome RuvABC DNA-binding subunit
MAQDLTVNIKTTSDVPQAMDKAKQATTEFGKQAEAVNKRFKDSIKDILLSTVGPMAALALVTNRINEYFEKIKQAQVDANQSAIDGINERMAKEDVYYARKVARLKEDKKESESARLQPQTTAFEFLMNDPRAGAEFGFKPSKQPAFGLPGVTAGEQIAETLSGRKSIQERVRQIIAEDLAKNGMIPKGGEGVKDKTASNFKGPEGFSNVVGVGANPVMEAMNLQLEEAQKQTALLEKIASPEGGVPKDFTKETK